MVYGGDLGHLYEARNTFKESIYDHYNYKGGLSTCTLNGLKLPLEDVSNKQVKPYSLDYQEYMWVIVGT